MNNEDEEFNRIEREAKLRMEAVSAALDKKAENARALGLDYEPAQQEPVAWCVINNGEIIGEPTLYLDGAEEILAGQIEGCGSEIAPLYTSPPPPQRTWVGLTDEQIEDIWADCPIDWDDQINILTFARAIEAAHGIKENT
jgi:hypothetical protein